MYLGSYSLEALNIFLTGVQTTGRDLDPSGKYGERFFGNEGFLQWTLKKHAIPLSASRLGPFLTLADNDDKIALDIFFSELELYDTACRKTIADQ